MTDLPLLHRPGVHLAPRGRPSLRSTSESPTRSRLTDDLISTLTPRAALDAFRHPFGALKACMDAATPSEQTFAVRAATASQNIQDWLDEVSSWAWPAEDSSAGFERPPPKRRKRSSFDGSPATPEPSADEATPEGEEPYLGSLPASRVSLYERRLGEISRDLEELDVEEIKAHVLHHHILPLSRPGTPLSDSNRPLASPLGTYARMDDLAAIATATVIQALPNLSKLNGLLNVWSIRLAILRSIPRFLAALTDAEVALRSGWDAINLKPRDPDGVGRTGPSPLSRSDFRVMQLVVEREVSRAGRHLDHMLDMLEGSRDTLPESWIDRMDALENEYGDWVAVCERKVRESEWAKLVQQSWPAASAPATGEQRGALQGDSTSEPEHALEDIVRQPQPTGMVVAPEDKCDEESADERVTSANAAPHSVSSLPRSPPAETETQRLNPDVVDIAGPARVVLTGTEESPVVVSKEGTGLSAAEPEEEDLFLGGQLLSDVPEPELPVLPRSRRGSDASNASTVVHGSCAEFPGFSSDSALDQGTPDFPRRQRGAVADAIPSEDASLPGSPQDFRSSTRSLSVSFQDVPTVVEFTSEESPPRTPVEFSSVEEDDLSGMAESPGSPSKMSTSSADDQLQQQISEILETIPAKIRLSKDPPPEVNLNPPDFNMPTTSRPRQRLDPLPRSHSSMSTASSRAGTPSFTLAPAYARNPRPRPQRAGNQEIKLYHLSRSNGEAPIKLFIRCVGERGERVMVRVGGGWADLGEYLKEYAAHHRRRSGGEGKVEVRDLPPRVVAAVGSRPASSPPSRPGSAMDTSLPLTPLHVRKTRKPTPGGDETAALPETGRQQQQQQPTTPLANPPTTAQAASNTPSSGASTRSRSSSRLSWAEEDSSLGMAGPKAKHVEMSEESRAWVESVKEKVRIASGELKVSDQRAPLPDGKFGDMGKVGATKRLFRRQG